MRHELVNLLSTQEKLDWLREQIEVRGIGLCWEEFRAHGFSTNDENIGSVEDLTGMHP